MAARPGAGTGVVVSLVVFIVATLALLVITIVFYSKQSEAADNRRAMEEQLDKIASREQRNRDDFQAILAQSGGMSAMGYLLEQQNQTMVKVLGNGSAMPAQIQTQLAAFGLRENESVRTFVSRLSSDLQAARSELDAANERARELQALVDQKDRQIRDLTESANNRVDAVTDRIDEYAQSVEQHTQRVEAAEARFNEITAENEQLSAQRRRELEDRIDNLLSEKSVMQGQVDRYQEVIAKNRPQGKDPAELVDANVLENPQTDGTLYIDRGRRDKIVLGMTFEVYDDETQIQFNEALGRFPAGKASVQIIKVAETTSTAKITRSSPGRPVVRGDVLANAVYDPNRTYTFLVHGIFDVDGDGKATEQEADLIRRMVIDWGGEIQYEDQITGDLDFLVLGVQPVKPAPLPGSPSDSEMEVWMQRNQTYSRYQSLLQQAVDARIPVLNANRFFILIGHTR